jgi:hypothetical protein
MVLFNKIKIKLGNLVTKSLERILEMSIKNYKILKMNTIALKKIL